MDTINTGYHWRLLISIGLLLLTSHTQSQDDAVFAHEPPTITLADWPLYPKLPASLLATVDKVVITSFNPGSYQSPHALLVTKHGRVYLYGKSPYLGLDGELWSMGVNSMGQLGRQISDSPTLSADDRRQNQQRVSGDVGRYSGRASSVASSEGRLGRIKGITNVVEICAGAQHGLARDDQGRVYMWGYELRDEGIVPLTQVYPGDASSYTEAVNISCGLHHNAFLTQDNKVYIWGANDQGQLGTGNTVAYPRPTRLPWQPEMDQIEQVTCGSSHTAVLTSSGNAYLWGSNSHGQLGLGKAATKSSGFQSEGSAQSGRTKPTVLTMGSFDLIMASGQMTLGCSWEGDLYAWGHIGGRDEFVPVQYAVECGRYRDLLCHGMTIDTGRMVSADTHAYGTDYMMKMLVSFEEEITGNSGGRDKRLKEEIRVFLDGILEEYNNRLTALATLILLGFIIFYALTRNRGHDVARDETIVQLQTQLQNMEKSIDQLKHELQRHQGSVST